MSNVTKLPRQKRGTATPGLMMQKEYKGLTVTNPEEAERIRVGVVEGLRRKLSHELLSSHYKIHTGVIGYIKEQTGLLQRGGMAGATPDEIQARDMHERQCRAMGVEPMVTDAWRRQYAAGKSALETGKLSPDPTLGVANSTGTPDATPLVDLSHELLTFLAVNPRFVQNLEGMVEDVTAGKSGRFAVKFGNFSLKGSGGVELD